MGFNNIRNVGNPKHGADAVPRSFLDNMIKEVEEKMGKLPHLIAVHARYCGPLKRKDYPFKFGGNSLEICEEEIKNNYSFKGLISGFVMPHSGRIKKIICEGLSYIDFDKMINKLIISLNEEQINILKLHFKKEDFKNDLLEKIKSTVNFSTRKGWLDNKPPQKGKTFFEIVKIKKQEYPNTNMLDQLFTPVISHRVIIEEFEWLEVEDPTFDNTKKEIIMKILNYDIETMKNDLKEGDTLNIQISDLQKDLFREGDLLENILTSTVIHLFSTLNFNFTFLIELDPL